MPRTPVRQVIDERLLDEKRAEARSLAGRGFSEVTPSRRDFTQFVTTQKTGMALVPRLTRAAPEIGAAWPDADLVALARVCDEAEIGALAVRTAAFYGGRPGDLAAVAAAVTAPLLHDEPCLDRSQIYQSRLQGADAVLLPAGVLAAEELAMLAGVARSVHMAPVVEVRDERGIESASALAQVCFGLCCPATDGFADLARARDLAASIPPHRTVLLLSEVRSLDLLDEIEGLIDAAVAGHVLIEAPEPAVLIAGFLARQQP